MGERRAVALAATPNVLTARLAVLYDKAACVGADPAQFDATAYTASARTTIRHYCSTCPVSSECHDLIGLSPGFSGIAGGMVWVGRGRPAKRGGR